MKKKGMRNEHILIFKGHQKKISCSNGSELKGWVRAFAVGVAQPELLKSSDGLIHRRTSEARLRNVVADLEVVGGRVPVEGDVGDLLLV